MNVIDGDDDWAKAFWSSIVWEEFGEIFGCSLNYLLPPKDRFTYNPLDDTHCVREQLIAEWLDL